MTAVDMIKPRSGAAPRGACLTFPFAATGARRAVAVTDAAPFPSPARNASTASH